MEKYSTTRITGAILVLLLAWLSGLKSLQAEPFIIVQSTTSTQNSGLYEALLPAYEKQSGVDVRVVAVGTGQALKNAENCDGDVLLVHAQTAEEEFVASGFGLSRKDVMYNDFVLLGPEDDPADIASAHTIEQALRRIADGQSRFISRGDDSGTHKAELKFWGLADFAADELSGSWYLETGQGMGATLNLAVQLGGYVLSDRATWLAFGNRQRHQILFEGDTEMFNQYGVIVINPAHCPQVKTTLAQNFSDWITSEAGQAAINRYNIAGEQLFFGNAR